MGARVRDGVRTRLSLLAGVAPLLCALPARAADPEAPFQVAGGGVFLGHAFGERGGFELGIEGFATRYFEKHPQCERDQERHGFGPLLRLTFVGNSRFELTLTAHGGGDLPSMRTFGALDAELGARLVLQQSSSPRLAPHSAIAFESIIFNLYFRQAWLFAPEALSPALSLGGGVRYLPTFGLPSLCVDGRPYRDELGEQQRASVRHAAGFDWANPRARLWAKRASDECASVPAFLQLAHELLELDAPLELVARALQAADEELGHTQAAARLAAQFGGAELSLAPPQQRKRRAISRPRQLQRLVTETWRDGCLNEGLAAAIASSEAEQTSTPEEARVLRRVAGEESGHAALAFDVLRWACGQAPELVGSLGPGHLMTPDQDHTWLQPRLVTELVQGNAASATKRVRALWRQRVARTSH